MVGLEIEPREVVLHEQVRNELVLLPSVRAEARLIPVTVIVAPRFREPPGEGREVDGGTSGYQRSVGWRLEFDGLNIVVLREVVVPCFPGSFGRKRGSRAWNK